MYSAAALSPATKTIDRMDLTNEPHLDADVALESVDLIVVGGGVAGLTAAITAAEHGADVLLIEKQDHLGGSALYAAGNLMDLHGPGALDHLVALSFGRTPVDVLAAYRDGLGELVEWLHGHGAQTEYLSEEIFPNCWPLSPGADGVRYFAVQGDLAPGPNLVRTLTASAARLGVKVRTQTSLVRLLSKEGTVVGLEARFADGTHREIRSRRGVILAAGGFENDPQLTDAYLPLGPVFPVGTAGNTGDALRAAESLGAALWHMSAFYGFWCYRVPGFASALPLLFFSPAHLMVGPDGRRFHAETGREPHDALRIVGDYLPHRPQVPGMPAHIIFDAGLLTAGPLCRFASPTGYVWSEDNKRELEAGWIRGASSPGELAEILGLDAEVLEQTIRDYNEGAATGVDDDFHRPASSMTPVDAHNLMALTIWPGVATTSGGPRRDSSARVLHRDGPPIPGLFAAGGTGGVWGHLTEHGGGLTDGLVFGRIAAVTAVGS